MNPVRGAGSTPLTTQSGPTRAIQGVVVNLSDDTLIVYCCSLRRNRIVPDVFVHSRAAGAAPDVMVRLRVLEAVSLPESATAREDKLADVVAVSRHIVVPEKRESLATPCQLGPEPRAM